MIFHQQLKGVAFPASVSKQNSDMNKKIVSGSPQTRAFPLLVAKQREVKRLWSSQRMGSIIPSTKIIQSSTKLFNIFDIHF